ncbi:thioredoxin family protein [candidate division KSB1 bacterium]|nr:thioredoxin family protein [candidate division KSB1 bacterium]
MNRLTALIFVILTILLPFGNSCQKAEKTEDMARGWVTAKDLQSYFATWDAETSDYEVNPYFAEKLDSLDASFTLRVFLGTWCPDSERELPRFMKIMHTLEKTKFNVFFYGLDRKQADKSGMREKFDIQLVPTFIVYKDDTEIGRIVESPEFSLEEDLFMICSRAK